MAKPQMETLTKQFRDFSGGLNLTDARTAMKDNQLYANENVQPIGSGNQAITPPQGASIASIGAGIATMFGVNMKISGAEVGRLITVNTDGSMTAINPLTGATTTIAAAATVTTKARVTMFQDTPLLIGDTNGYFSWDGTTLLKYPAAYTCANTNGTPTLTSVAPVTTGLTAGMALQGTGIPAGTTIKSVDSTTQITMTANSSSAVSAFTVGAGAPTSGVVDLAVFQGRTALVISSRSILVSAPASFTDFATADGSITVTITDSVFAGNIIRLLSALELLWVIGPNAINTESNFQTTSGVTTFANTNIVANVGTVLPSSVSSFFRTFLLLAAYGIYAVVGATPQKLSDLLDGLFPSLVLGTDQPAAVFSLNNVFVWGVLVTLKDPTTGLNRPIIICFARNAFFTVTQGSGLKWITGLVDPATGKPNLWGTDGTAVFQCFAGTGAGPYTWRTKLYDFGTFTQRKQVTRVFLETASPVGNVASGTLTLENESGGQATALTLTPANVLQFTGSGGAALNFVGSGTIIWVTAGIQQGRLGVPGFGGDYIGVQLAGTSLPFLITGLALEMNLFGEAT